MNVFATDVSHKSDVKDSTLYVCGNVTGEGWRFATLEAGYIFDKIDLYKSTAEIFSIFSREPCTMLEVT